MKKRRDTPWYKWRFTLGGLWLILFFGGAAWIALSDCRRPLVYSIAGAAFFAAIAIVFALLEWRNRRPLRISSRDDDTGREHNRRTLGVRNKGGEPGMLQLHMIPTSGDATLLRFVEDATEVNILIDGGNRKDDCLLYLGSLGVSKLQLIIASHLDEDHIRGLRRVANEIPVEELWITDISPFVQSAAESIYMAKCFLDARFVVDGRGIRDGNKLAVYDGFRQQLGPFFLEVLSPPKSLHDYLRRPSVVDTILKSGKGQAIRRYVQDAVREELRREGVREDRERREQVVFHTLERFEVRVPQEDEIKDLMEQDEVDWREHDDFFESARSLFNDISLVVKITYDYSEVTKTFLFPGDLTNWSLVLAEHSHTVRGCVTKVPHHGSDIHADRDVCIRSLFAEAGLLGFAERLPHPWHHLWEEWCHIASQFGEPPFPWLRRIGGALPWLSRDLGSADLYEHLSPSHSLIYPLRSSFRLPRLEVRNAIKANSRRTSCNYKQGKVRASRMGPRNPCMDCFTCVERGQPTVLEWGE